MISTWKEFLMGGTMMAAVTYFGNNVDPLLAGLIGGIPLTIPSLYFVSGNSNLTLLSNTLIFSTFALFSIVGLFHYLYVVHSPGIPKNRCILYSMILWLVLTLLIWGLDLPNRVFGNSLPVTE